MAETQMRSESFAKMANSVIIAPKFRHFYRKSGSPSQNPMSELLLDIEI